MDYVLTLRTCLQSCRPLTVRCGVTKQIELTVCLGLPLAAQESEPDRLSVFDDFEDYALHRDRSCTPGGVEGAVRRHTGHDDRVPLGQLRTWVRKFPNLVLGQTTCGRIR